MPEAKKLADTTEPVNTQDGSDGSKAEQKEPAVRHLKDTTADTNVSDATTVVERSVSYGDAGCMLSLPTHLILCAQETEDIPKDEVVVDTVAEGDRASSTEEAPLDSVPVSIESL